MNDSHPTKVMCDCELGHNGLGLAIRECDCQERKNDNVECNCRQPGLGGDCDGSCQHPQTTNCTGCEIAGFCAQDGACLDAVGITDRPDLSGIGYGGQQVTMNYICEACDGSGVIDSMLPATDPANEPCPVCAGKEHS